MANTCGGCTAEWQSLLVAHCASCHNTFSTVALFDRHRVSYRCAVPSRLRVDSGSRAGLPLMRLDDRGIWVSAAPRPEYWKAQA